MRQAGKWITGAMLAAAVVLALTSAGATGVQAQGGAADAGSGPTLTVQGHGSVTVVPDEARIDLGVTTRGNDAATALADNSTRMRAVIAALKQAGIAEPDIRTTGLNVSPVYSEPSSGSTPRIGGFQASDSVQVTLHDLSRVGPVIDAALQAGANQVSGIQLAVKDAAAIRRQAFQAAMNDARGAAEALASAAGLRLAGVRSVSENAGCYAVPFPSAAAVAAPSAPPPVLGGGQAVQVDLQVVFDVTR